MAINRQHPQSNATVIIENCNFTHNERGLTIIGPYKTLELENSHFNSNVAMHAGSAILVLIDEKTHFVIDNCTFADNMAGRYAIYQLGKTIL